MGSLASDHYIAPEIVELSGSPREIGFEHGRRLAGKIHSQIEVYTAMFRQTSKLDWPAVRGIAEEYRQTIEKKTPDLHAEMEGIAEGASVDVLDIVALNARSEIALGSFSDGCTSVGWKTESEGVFLSQNWDWTARVKKNLAFMSIEQVGKPKIWMVTEAGIVGKIGFNSSSVGVCLNAIRAKPSDPIKLPIHIVLRLFLESTSASSAISNLKSLGGVASSCHILIADPSGPTGLELSPKGDTHIPPNEKGIVCHTNHFLTNKFITEPPWLAGSPIRLDRANKLTAELAEGGKAVTEERLRDHVFSDTFNAPQAICCQEDPIRPIETRSSTLFNIITRFKKGEAPSAEVVWGRPGSGEEGPVLKMPW
ncbi:AAT-domain-containing protein [Mollisia scopiformis]|uniref:AAT-domain-containing protein n=1 Tax=Mollisia scopiformis TaxID=149040 RepID=A0A194XTE9_MOLSC|nr:AAT-domain-containing protein [Mollisia scopiformis]KUJ22972.1 AAT-domain-containing protein [Mollisia scopiformis]